MNTPRRILCVDDEEDILQIVKLSLELVGGYHVTTCGGGKDMLACVEALAPDMILLDVMMPEMDGPTSLRALRQSAATRQVPVVFMTAKVQPSEVAQYLKLGAAGVIPKPFDPMTLPRTVAAFFPIEF